MIYSTLLILYIFYIYNGILYLTVVWVWYDCILPWLCSEFLKVCPCLAPLLAANTKWLEIWLETSLFDVEWHNETLCHLFVWNPEAKDHYCQEKPSLVWFQCPSGIVLPLSHLAKNSDLLDWCSAMCCFLHFAVQCTILSRTV